MHPLPRQVSETVVEAEDDRYCSVLYEMRVVSMIDTLLVIFCVAIGCFGVFWLWKQLEDR